MVHAVPIEPEDAEATQPEVEPVYEDVFEFVTEWLLPRFRRNPKRYLWAKNWYEYPEVLDRLTAMHRAWEFYRLPEKAGITGMVTFWNDVFDPTMRAVTDAEGPFWTHRDGKYSEKHADGALPAELDTDTPPTEFFTYQQQTYRGA